MTTRLRKENNGQTQQHHFSAFPPKFRNGGEGVRGRHRLCNARCEEWEADPSVARINNPEKFACFCCDHILYEKFSTFYWQKAIEIIQFE